ncbi:MAG: DUF3885 domain-containing protein [Ruegeria sp.]
MANIFDQFDSAITCDEFPHAMFYEFEVGLRFELGGEGVPTSRPIQRFIQAFERVDAISSKLFENSNSLWLLSSWYGDECPKNDRLTVFKKCGISKSLFRYLGATSHEVEYDDDKAELVDYRHWYAAELDGIDKLREVLWLALGSELGIKPTVHATVYIVDFEKSIALHPYDDRGMDVVSMERGHLSALYNAHRSWLLDYDIPRMKDIFESAR